MRAAAVALAAALAVLATGASAITKCVDKAGKVTYQDGKCPDDARTDALKTPIPLSPPPMSTGSAGSSGGGSSAAPSGPTPPTGDEDPKMMDAAGTQSTFDNCDIASPGFTGRNGETYIGWRNANSALLAKYEPSPEYQRALEYKRAVFRDNIAPSPSALKQYAQTCETTFLSAMKNAFKK